MIKVRGVNQFLAGKGMSKPLQARDEGRFGEQVPQLGGDVTGMLFAGPPASVQCCRQSGCASAPEPAGNGETAITLGRRPIVALGRFDD
jgi:hypothetical protein